MAMTHDELLKELDDVAEFADYDPYPRAVKALRAVVELHKPKPEPKDSPFKDSCNGCFKTYPCKTIQAIEKELR